MSNTAKKITDFSAGFNQPKLNANKVDRLKSIK